MSELNKTFTFAGVAVLLSVIAMVSAPRRSAPDAFFDVGDRFFPEFNDPELAATLEIVQWDDATGSALPFEVTNRRGLWTIPSHHDYPADGADRLATAAAEIINAVKEEFRSDNIADYEALGVIDPPGRDRDEPRRAWNPDHLQGQRRRGAGRPGDRQRSPRPARVQLRTGPRPEARVYGAVRGGDLYRVRGLDRDQPARSGA